VRQRGRSVASRLLVIAWLPNEVSHVRVGFVVSKRISKRAAQRNYIKRILSEAIRPYLPELSGYWDVVISAKGQVVDARPQDIAQDVGVLLRRARLLSSTPTAQVPQEPVAEPGGADSDQAVDTYKG
jgi:ribonuclease P protein component